MAPTRREFLIGGAAFAAGALAMRALKGSFWPRASGMGRDAMPGMPPFATTRATAGRFGASRDTMAQYGHGVAPPARFGANALDALTIPPPYVSGAPRTREVALQLIDQRLEIAQGTMFDAWTFNGTLPGPILRATEGDTLRVTVQNRTGRAHNMHFHGTHDITQDGWEPLPPGGSATYEIAAGPFGLHPYHCDATPVAEHVSHGLFGTMIVDPRGGRPAAEERVLVLCGFDTNGDGRSDLYGWNGVGGFFERHPLRVPAGKKVRLHIVNMVADEPVVSFHLHAQTFDVFRTGTSLTPSERTDVVTLAHTERAIIEFTLPTRGRYMFHPHQARLAENGGMGWIAAT